MQTTTIDKNKAAQGEINVKKNQSHILECERNSKNKYYYLQSQLNLVPLIYFFLLLLPISRSRQIETSQGLYQIKQKRTEYQEWLNNINEIPRFG